MSVDKSSESEEKGRVRETLRSLEKHQAPWYLEADLRKRLSERGGTGRRSFLPLRIVTYAIPALALALVGLLAYFILPFSRDIQTTTEEEMRGPAESPAQQEQVTSQTPGKSVSSDKQGEPTPERSARDRGPSTQQLEPVNETSVMMRESIEETGKRLDTSIPLGTSQSEGMLEIAADSLMPSSAIPDTADTLSPPPDSLHQR